MPVHARLAGHGVTLVPRAPFSLERHGGLGGDAVVVTHRPAAALPRRLVLVPGDGGCRVAPGAGVDEAAEVAEVRAGPTPARWSIETPAFAMDWPAGFVVQSGAAPDVAPGFDLVAPGDVLLLPSGPFPPGRLTGRQALAGPGQRVVGEGEVAGIAWIELATGHELTPWRQRSALVPVGALVLLLTLRAPESSVETPAWSAALEAARTVRLA